MTEEGTVEASPGAIERLSPGGVGRSDPLTDSAPHIKVPRLPTTYTCGGCDNRWSGISRAHCSGCHRTFSGTALFDSHRRLRGDNGYCVDPATIVTGKGVATQVLRDGVWRSTKEFSNVGAVFGAQS